MDDIGKFVKSTFKLNGYNLNGYAFISKNTSIST